MQWLKQSTAQTVVLGPFVNDTDGKTAETELSIEQADIRVLKAGSGAFIQTGSAVGGTHYENGYYGCSLADTDLSVLGPVRVTVNKSGALPVWGEYMVLSSDVWDVLFGTDYLQVDLRVIGDSDVIQASHFDDGALTARAIGTDAITAAKIADDAVSEIQSGLSTYDGSDTSGVTTLLDRLSALRAGYLDAAVSSRSSHDAAAVKTAVEAEGSHLWLILADTNELQEDDIPALLEALETYGDAAWATGSGGDATAENQTAIINHLTGIKGGTWSGDTDTLEDIRDAVDGIEGSGGSGARTVLVTVQDGDGTALESASVRLTEGVHSYVATTDSSGEATFNLDDATYTVAISKAGYTYSGTTLVVDGDETKTYQMTALTITAPEDTATLCTIQFRVKLSDTAVSGAVCKAQLQGRNQASDGTILSNAELSDTTDSDGVAELQVVQQGSIVKGSGIYKIGVEIAGKPVASVETRIPNQSTILFEDLL